MSKSNIYAPHQMYCDAENRTMWWAYNPDDSVKLNYIGPFNYLSEAQECADELNEAK